MEWWHWLVVGLLLVALEMAASGGFYVIFFGIAALAVSGLHVIGAAGPLWVQLLAFSVLAVASLLAFRSPLLRWMKLDQPAAEVDSLLGETAVPLEDIAAGDVGRAELRGSVWSARNTADGSLAKGQRCVVVAVDRLMVSIAPEGARS
jgi:membrane protein implicated in regulation of membrane protease activity